MANKVTVSLITWNSERYLKDNLSSLVGQTFQDFNLVITDNNSKDNSVQVCQSFASSFSERFELISNSENLGFEVPHNNVISKSEGQYIFLLNPDVILEPEYLERCINFLDTHPQVGSVSGKIMRWQAEFDLQTGHLKQSLKTNMIDSLGLQIFKSGKTIERLVGQQDSSEYIENTEVFGVSGTVPVYPKSALESVAFNGQYLDNDFFAYKEDIDLAFRLRHAGWKSNVVGNAVAYHDRTAKSTVGMTLREKINYRKSKSQITNGNSYRNHLWMLQKNISEGIWEECKYYIIVEEIKKLLYIIFCEWGSIPKLFEVWKTRNRTSLKRNQIMLSRKVSDKEMLRWMLGGL